MDITFAFTKKREAFGRQVMFCEQGPVMCDSIAPNPAEYKNYMLRNPVHEATQNTPIYSKNDINTIRVEMTSSSMNHAEGGWPRDVNYLDPEASQRYRRKIEKEDAYIHCVMETFPVLDHYIHQNNAVELYSTYYVELPPAPDLERISCRTVNVYRDAATRTRPITSISFQPEGSRFAVTYNDVDYNYTPVASTDCYIWDIENANAPELTLTPPVPMLDLQFNARNTSMLAGGLMNGQVGLWDLKAGGEPQLLCPPHLAHRDLVRSVIFVNAKSGREFFSGGPDGVCKWWDARNMSEPIDEIILDYIKLPTDIPSIANSNGISVLEFEPTIPTRFMAGTENGFIVCGNRKGKSQSEKLPAKFFGHLGPVYCVERNPGFLKNFLTVGDWSFRIFSEECKESPVMWSQRRRHRITNGTWSPTRLSLIGLVMWNGRLELWDVLRRLNEPVLSVQICHEPLLRIKIHETGAFIACGSQKGNIYMVEMSKALTMSDKNDKQYLTSMFEREARREHILETRLREIRLKLRQAEEGSIQGSTTEMDAIAGDRDLNEATTEYNAIVKKELAAM